LSSPAPPPPRPAPLSLHDALPICRLGGTPWAPRMARLLGIEVGTGARLGSVPSPTALMRIGAGATLEGGVDCHGWWIEGEEMVRSEEHTSELQSRGHLVCRLLLEK